MNKKPARGAGSGVRLRVDSKFVVLQLYLALARRSARSVSSMRLHSPTQPLQQKATFLPFQVVVGLSAGRAQSGCMGQRVLTAPMSAAVLGALVLAQPVRVMSERAVSARSLFMGEFMRGWRGCVRRRRRRRLQYA